MCHCIFFFSVSELHTLLSYLPPASACSSIFRDPSLPCLVMHLNEAVEVVPQNVLLSCASSCSLPERFGFGCTL